LIGLVSPRSSLLFRAFCILAILGSSYAHAQRWSEEQANRWYAQQPWLVGSNFIPKDAINQLEMWQAETFDPEEIDKELGWAEGLGMNTMRVFLHDLLWQQDAAGFQKRVDMFLAICAKHRIRPIFVLFDSCWEAHPKLGPQHAPIPGVHNSGWVQSPGADALSDPTQRPRLKAYVQGIVGAFASDPRVLAWDVWNEPSNDGGPAPVHKGPKNKAELVEALLPQVFEWVRAMHPAQPLTSGVWNGNWSSDKKLGPIQRIQVEQSDVISFHAYGKPKAFEKRIAWLRRYHRPLLCTEYMARPLGSTFPAILPIAKQQRVAAINWGFVVGKTQTNFPWDSWKHPYVEHPPKVWFHDVLDPDGKPYREDEARLIRELTKISNAVPAR
jgi:hypothetical protein